MTVYRHIKYDLYQSLIKLIRCHTECSNRILTLFSFSYLHLLAVIGDYAGVPELELTFGPTTNEHKITLFIIDDPALEHTESFQAVMSVPDGEQSVTFLHHQATISILDNDGGSCTLSVTITTFESLFPSFSLQRCQ